MTSLYTKTPGIIQNKLNSKHKSVPGNMYVREILLVGPKWKIASHDSYESCVTKIIYFHSRTRGRVLFNLHINFWTWNILGLRTLPVSVVPSRYFWMGSVINLSVGSLRELWCRYLSVFEFRVWILKCIFCVECVCLSVIVVCRLKVGVCRNVW